MTAKLRYRSPAVAATVEQTAGGFRLKLDEPAYGVARGQAAVLYDGDVVVGSGLVTSGSPLTNLSNRACRDHVRDVAYLCLAVFAYDRLASAGRSCAWP